MQAQQAQLENEEYRDDRQQRDGHLSHVIGYRGDEGRAYLARVGKRGGAYSGGRLAVVIEKSEDEHREYRSDRAQRNKTEAVGFGGAVASYHGNAKPHREDKRHRHRPGGDAAGVESDAKIIAVGERGQHEDEGIAGYEQPSETCTGEDAQHAHRHEKSDAHADGYEQHAAFYVRNGLRKHLKIRLGYGYRKAKQKAHPEDQRQIFCFGQRRADLRANGHHRLLRTQRKQAHTGNYQQSADEKAQQQIGLHRHHEKAQHYYYRDDRQHRNRRLARFFDYRSAIAPKLN